MQQLTRPGTAAEVAKAAPLEPPAKEVLRPEQSPKDYLDALAKAGHLADAVRFMAHALPRRETVWWAIQCVKSVPDLPNSEQTTAALVAAEKWAADPTDENRRAAHAAAQVAGFDKPASCCALAAFFAEGSLAPAHLPEVPPPPHAAPVAAATAVVLAAVTTQPDKADEKYRKFLALGFDVAAGTNRWKGDRPAAAPAGAGAPQPARPAAPPPPPKKEKGWY
jgi:hypothetical protein